MSETGQKKTTRKPRATKSTTGTTTSSLEKGAETMSTKAQSNALVEGATSSGQPIDAMKGALVLDDETKTNLENIIKGKDDEILGSTETADALPGGVPDAVGILGGFRVRAKSDAGFWRSGVQFLRLQEKLVLVVDKEPHASARVHAKDHEPEFVVFLTAEKAKRVHSEPNLIIEEVELSDVLDIDDMK